MKAPPPLADAADRARFTQEFDQNFCVSASAGAGKTTAITRRIAGMLHAFTPGESDPLPRLAVVTYTKAAAAELKFRARRELQQMSGNDLSRFHQNLSRLNQAFFGTIHSFMVDLLQEHGPVLGLPSQVTLLEPEDATHFFHAFLDDDRRTGPLLTSPSFQAALRHTTFDKIAQVAANLTAEDATLLLQQSPVAAPTTLSFDEAVTFVPKRKPTEALLNNQAKIRRWKTRWEKGARFLPIPKFTTGGREFLELANEAFAPLRRAHACHLGLAAASLALAALTERINQGRMTYDDMIFWAHRLIDHPEILDQIRQRNLRIILDEAQDTNPSMFAVLIEITRPPGSEPHTWPTHTIHPPRPGHFCFVGDDQQTIYGNRSNLQVYQNLVAAFTAGNGGHSLTLSVTMRMPQNAVAACNAIFPKRLIQPHVHFRKLDARPDAITGNCTLLTLPPIPEDLSAEAAFTWEVSKIARWLARKTPEELGSQRWQDIAILAPRNDWLDEIARIFSDHGLPVEKLSSRQARSTLPGFTWPLALLHVLLEPDDRFELIGILREIFCLSDPAIFAAHRHRTDGLSLNPNPSDDPALADALKQLRLLQDLIKPGTGPAHALSEVITALALPERLEAIEQTLAPLRWVRHQAALAEAQGESLHEWVDRMRSTASLPLPLASEENAMPLLSCHKAKGLEWTTVILIGMGRQFGQLQDPYPRLDLTPSGPTLAFQKEDLHDPDSAKTSLKEQNQRLLYVALTRVKQQLFLCLSAKVYSQSIEAFQETILWSESIPEGPWTVLPLPAEDQPDLAFTAKVEPVPEPPILVSLTPPAFPARLLPHELGHALTEDPTETPREFEVSVGGMGYGTWWHETMQFFPWTQPDLQEAFLQERLRLATDQAWKKRAADELSRFLEADFWKKWVAENSIFLTEVPFLHPLRADAWLDGVIDLVVIRPQGRAVVLDWKTDRPHTGEKESSFRNRLTESYGPQLAAYRGVVEKLPAVQQTDLWLYATVRGDVIILP
jgi:ATP-dependent exoDNAse (exonuclease V) beta subunit